MSAALIAAIAVALAFAFTNGIHDAADAIAASIVSAVPCRYHGVLSAAAPPFCAFGLRRRFRCLSGTVASSSSSAG